MPSFRPDLDKRRADVSAMFDGVAERYDLMNSVLTLGLDKQWRQEGVAAVDPRPGDRILDLAAGTGASSLAYRAHDAVVVPADISLGMLHVGKKKHPELPFTAGDALQLPFRDDSFDAVTIAYGLRNVENTLAALREMLRVTKPGGRVVIQEFSTPTNAAFRWVYSQVALHVVPAVAVVSSNPPAYQYLAESIRAWPDQEALAGMMCEAGWKDIEWRNMSGGIVALHRGWKR